MWNVNKQILIHFLALVLLFYGIKGEISIKQEKIPPRAQQKNNFSETPGEAIITTSITVNDEEFDDNELRKLFVRHFTVHKNFVTERSNKVIEESNITRYRKIRDANLTKEGTLDCLFCGAQLGPIAKECYAGTISYTQKCSNESLCFTEIHPNYIKRGCILPGRMNRTFVCKCPLCNDKPSYDYTYYTYSKISEWEYDNQRLQKPVEKMDLMCKVCATTGKNLTLDKLCKAGTNVEYAVCAQDHVCYTNIDDELDHVSRGCVPMPVFNSMYLFCNTSLCNKEMFDIRATRKRAAQIQEKFFKHVQPKTLVKDFAKNNMPKRSPDCIIAKIIADNILLVYFMSYCMEFLCKL